MRAQSWRCQSSGQALVEFAIVVPILLAILGGIIQFGIIFWAQNTLTQVVRDTGRWEASQQSIPCNAGGAGVAQRADSIASNASLIGYTSGEWASATTYTTWPPVPDNRPPEGVEVAWPTPTNPPDLDPSKDCPPSSNATAWFVTIRLNHRVPVFLPGLQYLPGLGTCDSSGCSISLSATTTFRMEPAPAK
jgi:TadE-like protein